MTTDPTPLLTDLEAVSRSDFVAVDVEGDGNNPPAPVEIGMAVYRSGSLAGTRCWIVNPGRPMSEFVQGLHGITDEMAAGAPRFSEIEHEVRGLLEGSVMAAHGAQEDLRMLRTVLPEIDFIPAAVIDTQRMAKSLVPGLPRYRLESVCAALGIDVPQGSGRGGLHDASNDAGLAAACFLKLAKMIPEAPRLRRHHAAMAQVVLQPKAREERLEELAVLGVFPGGSGGARP